MNGLIPKKGFQRRGECILQQGTKIYLWKVGMVSYGLLCSSDGLGLI